MTEKTLFGLKKKHYFNFLLILIVIFLYSATSIYAIYRFHINDAVLGEYFAKLPIQEVENYVLSYLPKEEPTSTITETATATPSVTLTPSPTPSITPLPTITSDRLTINKEQLQNLIAYAQPPATIEVFNSNENKALQIFKDPNGSINKIAWSPNKQKLAFSHTVSHYPDNVVKTIWVWDLSSGNVVPAETATISDQDSPAYRYSFVWGENDDVLLIQAFTHLWKINLKTEHNQLITEYLPSYNPRVIVTQDSYYFTNSNTNSINKISHDGTNGSVVYENASLGDVAYDESYILFSSDSKLYLYNFATMTLKTIIEQDTCGSYGFLSNSISPDQSNFVLHFQCGDGIRLWLYDSFGNEINEITPLFSGIPLFSGWNSNATEILVSSTPDLGHTRDHYILNVVNGETEQIDLTNKDSAYNLCW